RHRPPRPSADRPTAITPHRGEAHRRDAHRGGGRWLAAGRLRFDVELDARPAAGRLDTTEDLRDPVGIPLHDGEFTEVLGTGDRWQGGEDALNDEPSCTLPPDARDATTVDDRGGVADPERRGGIHE